MARAIAKILIIAVSGGLGFSPLAAEAKRVLYLGDSLSMGAFGKTLDGELRAAHHEVFTYVTGGATPYYWLSVYAPMNCTIGHWEKTPHSDTRRNVVKQVPKVEELIERHRPEVVIVQTGTNLYATLRSKRRSKAENVREFTNVIENMCKTVTNAGAQLYWISPPDSHTGRYPRELQEEMLALTKSVVGRYGTVYESARVTRFTDPYPKTDGIHYGPSEAKEWGTKVASHFIDWSSGRSPKPPIIAAAEPAPPRAIVVGPGEASSPPPAVAVATPFEESPPRAIMLTAPTASTALVATASPVVFAATAAPQRPPVDIIDGSAPGFPEADRVEPEEELPPQAEIYVVRRAQLADGASDVVDVSMTLRAKTSLPHLSEVTYRSAFAIYEWEVDSIREGSYPYNVIRVAHPVVWNGRRMGAADYEIGRTTSLKLKVLSAYPSLERLQTIDDLPLALELPVYTASLD